MVYIDDIIIYSKDFSQHLERLDMVFSRLREAGLQLKPKKCHLMKDRVLYLGHIVSREGVATDPQKVEKVRNWPVPQDVHEVSTSPDRKEKTIQLV